MIKNIWFALTYNSNDFMFWNEILHRQFLDISDYVLLGFVILNIVDDCLRVEEKLLS